jgi:hypothetical protein
MFVELASDFSPLIRQIRCSPTSLNSSKFLGHGGLQRRCNIGELYRLGFFHKGVGKVAKIIGESLVYYASGDREVGRKERQSVFHVEPL